MKLSHDLSSTKISGYLNKNSTSNVPKLFLFPFFFWCGRKWTLKNVIYENMLS